MHRHGLARHYSDTRVTSTLRLRYGVPGKTSGPTDGTEVVSGTIHLRQHAGFEALAGLRTGMSDRNNMKFLLHAQVAQDTIDKQLGSADYSYFFLLRAFSTVLAELGDVVQLREVGEAEPIHTQCLAQNEPCVLLSFAPPHKTPLGLPCPIVPVFAWEYPDIPGQIEEISWMDDPRHDWRRVFALTGRAITLSSHTVEAVRRSMGDGFPIVAIPAPIRQIAWREEMARLPDPTKAVLLKVNASVADSRRMGLDVDGLICLDEEDGTGFSPSDDSVLPQHPAYRGKSDE